MKKPPVPIDPRLVEYLRSCFGVSPIVPGVDKEQLLYEAGQQSVLDHMSVLAGKSLDPINEFAHKGITK